MKKSGRLDGTRMKKRKLRLTTRVVVEEKERRKNKNCDNYDFLAAFYFLHEPQLRFEREEINVSSLVCFLFFTFFLRIVACSILQIGEDASLGHDKRAESILARRRS